MDADPLPAADSAACFIKGVALMLPDSFGIDQIIALLIAILALALSGFISGSEIAFFSIPQIDDEELDNTDWGARIRRLLAEPERLLATVLIGNNLVNVAIVILCNYALGPVFAGMSELWSFVLQTVILTFLILLFGEILPKLYANAGPLRWARFAYGGVSALVRIFHPLSSMLVSSTGIVNRIVTKRAESLTADDLSQALEITDLRAPDAKEMLEGILKFGETTAAEIMTPRVDITDIDITSSFHEVMETVISSGYSRLPVYEDTQDNIRGILYARDLLPYIGCTPAGFEWQKLLREAYFVPESRMIDDLLEDFRRRHIHMAVVIDEFGGTRGLVTLEDVLEEIVGDIDDEYDNDEKTYRRLPDDTYIFDGKTPLTDFFRITGLDPDEYDTATDDCETVAGMLLAAKGDFPAKKESIVIGRCRFLVLDVSHHRIAGVRVKVMPQVQPDAIQPGSID